MKKGLGGMHVHVKVNNILMRRDGGVTLLVKLWMLCMS